jgi:hypothetical protein
MDKRKEAIQWWNTLSSLRKTQICDTHTELVGSVRRWETLKGREIEMLYNDECLSDVEIMNTDKNSIGNENETSFNAVRRSFILKDNLATALYMAIKHQEKREQEAGYKSESALLSGWRENLACLENGYALNIKYEW